MATLIIIPLSEDNKTLNTLIPEKFGNASCRLPNGDWLVSYEGTSKQLSDELGISEGICGKAVVLNFSGFWGYADSYVWEWMGEYSK
jgi:hypothetical protein